MELWGRLNKSRKYRIDTLLKIFFELNEMKKETTDEKLLRDYEIYLRDIKKFLDKAAVAAPSMEDLQVYIDDYEGVITNLKAV